MIWTKRPGVTAALIVAVAFGAPGLFAYFSDMPLSDEAPMASVPEAAAVVEMPPLPPLVSPDTTDVPSAEPAPDLSVPPEHPSEYRRDSYYVVISRRLNHLWLMRNGGVVLDAVCATGKGDTLVWEAGQKTWVFQTPTGRFHVRYKTDSPRWVPPEWDYVERGEEPPDWLGRARSASYDMLGDYCINIGGDLNIHGTLYENLLGRSITHGCIRVGARDLAQIYSRIRTGSEVFIY